MERGFPEPFRSQLSYDIFKLKYAHEGCETWEKLADVLVEDVCQDFLPKDEKDDLKRVIARMQFLPGGRYLYYAGRPKKFFNNCYLLQAEEDSREDWASLSMRAESCLLTGGGIGVDYSRYRGAGAVIRKTGGVSSGPIPAMYKINEIGRNVMQGGSRRSALYASLRHSHSDVHSFLTAKNWHDIQVPGTTVSLKDVKNADFNFPAPLDMTNISVNYDTKWLLNYLSTGDVGEVFKQNVKQALTTGEPGFSFNFFDKEQETLRNACTEVTSEDDSDVCNLGSINLSRVGTIRELATVTYLATKFLICGTLRADLPYDKIKEVREKNRRLGLGLMGIHEWLIQRGYKYEVNDELRDWLAVYRGVSDDTARVTAEQLCISAPIARRSIAPTGTIGLIAGTTTGIEPIFAVAYKRRYLTEGKKWKYQYAVDHVAQTIIEELGVNPDTIETAQHLATDFERRIKFQAEVQDYVDMAISSTINLPSSNSVGSMDQYATEFTSVLAKYAPRLRGFTCYPDGSRGGQPLTTVSYKEALDNLGKTFDEHVEANDQCEGGVCGI